MIAEDQHPDAPPGEAGTGQQAARTQLDVVAVGADEENALGQVQAGIRPT